MVVPVAGSQDWRNVARVRGQTLAVYFIVSIIDGCNAHPSQWPYGLVVSQMVSIAPWLVGAEFIWVWQGGEAASCRGRQRHHFSVMLVRWEVRRRWLRLMVERAANGRKDRKKESKKKESKKKEGKEEINEEQRRGSFHAGLSDAVRGGMERLQRLQVVRWKRPFLRPVVRGGTTRERPRTAGQAVRREATGGMEGMRL